MSKEDEMFKELGYHNKGKQKKYQNYLPKDTIIYEKRIENNLYYYIEFDLYRHTIKSYKFDNCYEIIEAREITIEELQAINEKCKELGWL